MLLFVGPVLTLARLAWASCTKLTCLCGQTSGCGREEERWCTGGFRVSSGGWGVDEYALKNEKVGGMPAAVAYRGGQTQRTVPSIRGKRETTTTTTATAEWKMYI